MQHPHPSEELQWQLDFLIRASHFLFDPSVDTEHDAQTQLARIVVPDLADICLVQRTHPAPWLPRLASKIPLDSWMIEVLNDWSHLEQTSQLEHSQLYSSVLDLPELKRLLVIHSDLDSEFLTYSCMIVPLKPRGKRPLGRMIFFISQPSRTFSAVSLRLAEEIANRGAVLIENIALAQDAHEKGESIQVVSKKLLDELSGPMDFVLTTTELLRRRLHYHKEDRHLSRLARSVRHSAEKIKTTLRDLSKAS